LSIDLAAAVFSGIRHKVTPHAETVELGAKAQAWVLPDSSEQAENGSDGGDSLY